MTSPLNLLQIVPSLTADGGGVSDYARLLAFRLQERHEITSTFISAAPVETSAAVDGLEVLGPLQDVAKTIAAPEALLLHYVNYGYHPRGVPTRLPAVLRRLKERGGARLVTVFHEVYATSSWRRSAFWLGGLQKQIARSIAQLSDEALVSNETQAGQLQRLAPATRIVLQPVMSNFGEPPCDLAKLAKRDPHRWAICGGIELLDRSLRSFVKSVGRIPEWYAPHDLFIVGGKESSEIRALFARLPGITSRYFPSIDSHTADEILGTCAFGWIDYFDRPGVATNAILKSTVFAAFCAHGVIPVLPHLGSTISVQNHSLPGPYFLSESVQNFPAESERISNAQSIQEWYARNASSEHLADTVASAFDLTIASASYAGA